MQQRSIGSLENRLKARRSHHGINGPHPRRPPLRHLDEPLSPQRVHGLPDHGARNAVFQILLATVTELLRESRRMTITRVGHERALQGHRAILAAVKAGDAPAARDAMLRHLAMAEEDLRSP